jgi:hypothetical protein
MKALSLPVLSLSLLLAACGGGITPSADTTNPNITLSAVQNGTAVSLSAAASDDVGVSRVEFYRGTTLISTDTSEPYTASVTVSSADNGSVGFTAKAYDAAGNSASDTRTLNVSVTSKTIYQGVWGWGLVNDDSEVVYTGLVVLNRQDNPGFGLQALGSYGDFDDPANEASDLLYTGKASMGPLTGAGKLQVRLDREVSAGNFQHDILADDDDNRFETINDRPTFYDDDAQVWDENGKVAEVAAFIMFQLTDQVSEDLSANGLRLQAVNPLGLNRPASKASMAGTPRVAPLKSRVLQQFKALR